MKTTIKVQTTTTQEVEVSLPLFSKVVTEYFIDYYAIYDAEDSQKNMTLTVFTESKKFIRMAMLAGINNAIKGEVISSREFANILSDVTEEIISLQVHARATTTNDPQGEYYIREQEQLLNNHE